MPYHASSWPSTSATAAIAASKAQLRRVTGRRYGREGGRTSSSRRISLSSHGGRPRSVPRRTTRRRPVPSVEDVLHEGALHAGGTMDTRTGPLASRAAGIGLMVYGIGTFVGGMNSGAPGGDYEDSL